MLDALSWTTVKPAKAFSGYLNCGDHGHKADTLALSPRGGW
jgi:hypothetical protein